MRTALLLGVLALGVPSPAGATAVEPPPSGAYLGAYAQFGDGDLEEGVTAARLDAFERLAGQRLGVVRFTSNWGRGGFPASQVRLIRSRGGLPAIHWAPRTSGARRGERRFKLQRIVDGDRDRYLRRWLRAARREGGPLLVEFGVEMNGDWFRNWDGAHNGGARRSGFGSPRRPDGPERYAVAYRRIARIAREAGARNVSFGFHVNAPGYTDARWNRFANYYPGDRTIDWVGMSAYGVQVCSQEDAWEWPEAIIGPAYRELARLAPDKPLYIGEGGVDECPRLGSKPQWVRRFFAAVRDRYPRIALVNWWSEAWPNGDGSRSNLRLDSSAATLAAWRAAAADPYWRHSYP